MSTLARPRTSARSRERRKAAARRRLVLLLAAVGLLVVGIGTLLPRVDEAVKDVVSLPLRHDDIIRQQAEDKGLDPALIAAVIFAESHFRDQTSHAGARGLMQLTPATAHDIARRSGGTAFTEADLAIEYEVVARLKPGIIMCREKQDATSAGILEKILADEEGHIDYLETQLELMDKLGEALYAAQCVSRPPQ